LQSINSIAVTPELIEFVENYKLLETNDIVITDHRACVIEVNLSEYFSEIFSKWDQINKIILDPSRRSHRQQFAEELKEFL
jgi:predicted membrane-bound spermidine synthase